MRIIKTSMLREFWQAHREAEASLRTWAYQTKAAQWRNFAQVRKTFPSADSVRVASGRRTVVFNIAHNRYLTHRGFVAELQNLRADAVSRKMKLLRLLLLFLNLRGWSGSGRVMR